MIPGERLGDETFALLDVLEYGILDPAQLANLFGYCGITAKPGTAARLLKRASFVAQVPIA